MKRNKGIIGFDVEALCVCVSVHTGRVLISSLNRPSERDTSLNIQEAIMKNECTLPAVRRCGPVLVPLRSLRPREIDSFQIADRCVFSLSVETSTAGQPTSTSSLPRRSRVCESAAAR